MGWWTEPLRPSTAWLFLAVGLVLVGLLLLAYGIGLVLLVGAIWPWYRYYGLYSKERGAPGTAR